MLMSDPGQGPHRVRRVTLASKVMGRVVTIRVREGSETRLCETMALLDDRTTQAQLAESRAAAEAAAFCLAWLQLRRKLS